jgi:hypothetical protein
VRTADASAWKLLRVVPLLPASAAPAAEVRPLGFSFTRLVFRVSSWWLIQGRESRRIAGPTIGSSTLQTHVIGAFRDAEPGYDLRRDE